MGLTLFCGSGSDAVRKVMGFMPVTIDRCREVSINQFHASLRRSNSS